MKQNLFIAKLLLAMFLVVSTSSIVGAQDCVAICGEVGTWSGPEVVLRYKVIDDETRMPIKDARIDFEAQHFKNFHVRTDENGIGIIMIMDQDDLTSAKVEIILKNYQYFEQEIDYRDLKHDSANNKLYINGMQYDWTFSNRPSMAETVNALRVGTYRIIKHDSVFCGPGCFEFTVEMRKVRPKIDLE